MSLSSFLVTRTSRKTSLHSFLSSMVNLKCWGVGCLGVGETGIVSLVHVSRSRKCHPPGEPTS